MAKPPSSAAVATQLPNEPSAAQTISGELSWQLRRDLGDRIVPWLHDPQGVRPCLAYRAPVGVGKTGAMVDAIVDALKLGLRIAVRAPTQALASEILIRIDENAPGAAFLWRGREQSDPSSTENRMCRRTDAIQAAQAVGGSPRDVCGSQKRGFCKHNPNGGEAEPCGYLQQQAGNAHVVIFTGDAMLKLAPRQGMKRSKAWRPYVFPSEAPETLFEVVADSFHEQSDVTIQPMNSDTADDVPAFDLIMLDETDPFGMLKGFNSPPTRFDPARTLPMIATLPNLGDREILEGFLSDVHQACASNGPASYLAPMRIGSHYLDIAPDGNGGWLNIDDAPLIKSNLGTLDFIDSLDTIREIALENIPKPQGQKSFHKLGAKEIRDMNTEVVQRSSLMLAIASVCKIMANGLLNDLPFMRHLKVSKDGSGIHIRSLDTVYRRYACTPTVILDATLRPDLLAYSYDGLELVYDRSAVDGNGVTRYQLRDSDLSYSTLSGQDWPARLELFGMMCRRMLGRTGLIVPKSVRDRLIGETSPDLIVAHHGALRGLNTMESVSVLVVASRQMIAPSEAEDLAAVLSTTNVEALPAAEQWYPARTSHLRWREDERAGWPVRYVRHPDSITEAVRGAITEDGLEQALGRGRSVRRTRERPLTEFILTSTPTNRPVDGTFTMAQLKAATGWVGAFLETGFWVPSGEKGLGGVLSSLLRTAVAQRPESLYISLIGNPAFESPDAAADWRKKQTDDNPEIGALAREIDKALGARAESVEILYTPYPLHDFTPVQAKVRGSRYFARVYVRTCEGQTAAEALTALLGPMAAELEIKNASGP